MQIRLREVTSRAPWESYLGKEITGMEKKDKKPEAPKEFTVKMPISVETGIKKKRKHYLNMNLFRNNHMHTNNNIKKEYARIAHGVIPIVKFKKIELEYVLYLPNKLKRDISNVLSIVDKSFCDALVAHGTIEDDNYEYLQKVTYRYGGMDENKKGYVLITVREVD